MKVPDLEYYQVVADTQKDPEILKAELVDFIKEVSEFMKKSKDLKSNERASYYECPKCGDYYPTGRSGCYLCNHED
ncbi:MAG: hypothetical protein PF503_18790 [Desulfobacula sp.]|nr:hypothetical protein [Desulfobacula sp.]